MIASVGSDVHTFLIAQSAVSKCKNGMEKAK